MHAVIHAWYVSGLISRSVYISIADSGPRGPRYIGALLYKIKFAYYYFQTICCESLQKLSKGHNSANISCTVTSKIISAAPHHRVTIYEVSA